MAVGTNMRLATSRFATLPRSGSSKVKRLSQDVVHDSAVNIGQAKVASRMSERESLMIHAQQMQERGMQVVVMDLVLDRVVAVIVGRTVPHARFHASPSQPHGARMGIVVAAISASLRYRSAAKLAAP